MTREFVPEAGRKRRPPGQERRRAGRRCGSNIRTLKAEVVERPSKASGYMSDGLGHVRIKWFEQNDNLELLTGRSQLQISHLG